MEPASPKEALHNALGEVQTYLETTKDYLKLQVFKMAMHLVTTLGKILLVGLFALLGLLFLSYSAALSLGDWMGNTSYGFLTVGVAYVLIFAVAYVLRDRIEAPLLRHFSKLYFES